MAQPRRTGGRAGTFWCWTASAAIHAAVLCISGIPVAEAPAPEPIGPAKHGGWPVDASLGPFVAPPCTVWVRSAGEEDAISDIPLGGTGVSGSLGAGGCGMAGVYGSGRDRRAKAIPEPRYPAVARDATQAALDWLLRHQRPDGHWEPCARGAGGPEGAGVPATALALLAIMEASEAGQSRECDLGVRGALAWLAREQREDGAVFGRGAHRSAAAWAEYSHTLAALALLEGGERLETSSAREPARRALAFSLTRHAASLPGWEAGGSESAADHAGWHLTLLRRAREAGFFVPERALRWAGLSLAAMRRLEAAPVGPCGRRSAWRGARVMEVFAASLRPELDDRGLGMPPPAAPNWPARDLRAWRWSALTAALGDEAWRAWAREAGMLLARKQFCGGPQDGSESDLDGSWEAPPGEADSSGPYRGRLFATALGTLILADRRPSAGH